MRKCHCCYYFFYPSEMADRALKIANVNSACTSLHMDQIQWSKIQLFSCWSYFIQQSAHV